MNKDKERKARIIIKDIREYQDAYNTLLEARYSSIEADFILEDFFEINLW